MILRLFVIIKSHQKVNCTVVILGHSPAWEYTNVTEGEDNLNLIDQIDHKIEFIREELPPDQQLILIGHSIGVYIVLKMLEIPFISKRLVHAVCLFPAIEHLKETPNGKFWMPVSKYCRFPLALLALSFSYMPIWFKNMLVAWRAKGRPVHEHLIKPCHSCVSFSLINRALYMAASEMEHLNEMDEQLVAVIQENIKKLTFYYGACDKWAPMSFFKRMVTRFPLADIRLCTSGYPHDFVLDSSEEVAKLCFDILISYEVL